jgi:hypothetical protein
MATAALAVVPLSTPLSAADLCQGLSQDRLVHAKAALAKPAVGQAVLDPRFGTTLRRITAAAPIPNTDAAIVPVYSTVSAWNADESLLLLYHVGRGHELYHGRTYAFQRLLDISPNDVESVYWHTSNPDILLYLSGKSLMRYRVASRAKETIRAFTTCTAPLTAGADPMFTSFDSDRIGLKCGSTVFVYRISTNTITGSGTSSLDPPKVAASGLREFSAGWVLDPALSVQRRLDLVNPYDHASLGKLANGRDTYNTVAFDPGPAGSGVGSLVTFDMLDGTSRVVVGPATGWPYPPGGTHVSALAYRAPGWVFLSIGGNPAGTGVLDSTIVVADANTGRACRAAHHRSYGNNNTRLRVPYWAEPHVVASPTGTRAVFASDWGNGSTVDTYVVELPADIGLMMSVSTNKTAYTRGNAMTASLSMTNAGRPATVDILLFEVLPGGDQVLLLTPTGTKAGRLSKPSTLAAMWPGVDLRTPFQSSGPFLSYTWTGTEPAGTYAWAIAAVRPGSLADDRFDPGDVYGSWSTLFTFTK